MNIEQLIQKMTLEEKAKILTGGGRLVTFSIPHLGIEPMYLADGPHGVRTDWENNSTHFPNVCNLAASWNKENAHKMGEALGEECQKKELGLLLAPGLNIKRTPLCGRNFEYFSEDPVLSGELAAEYVNGIQSKGVGACVKHYAVNSQEMDRVHINAEVDERTLRELYLKGFEIAVKKSNPATVMCAYNKVNAIWCSENKMLLKDILKEEWGYDGVVLSDWCAVQDICKALMAGLDWEMPMNEHIVEQLQAGLAEGRVTMERIDEAVSGMLRMILKASEEKKKNRKSQRAYDRDEQHRIAREIAEDGIVLLKHNGVSLPLTKEKYKKIAIIGEFGKSPLIGGQGSAEVHVHEEYIDSPLEELRKLLPEVGIQYYEWFKKCEFSREMLWTKLRDFDEDIKDCDAVIIFAGSMESDDTERLDRRSILMNPNYDMFIEEACEVHPNVIVVLQTGSAVAIGEWRKKAAAVLEMYLAGESAGGAIADVLCGVVNPSGKLPETFPKYVRKDMDYPGEYLKAEYKEKLEVGYRYYDKHPEEICYPFGHGLSYTSFAYADLDSRVQEEALHLSMTLENTGAFDGSEVLQVYIGNPTAVTIRPIKELKAFEKVFLKAGERKEVSFEIPIKELGYYNIMLRDWVTEPGKYVVYVGSSSRDIHIVQEVEYNGNMVYTLETDREAMVG